MPRIGAPSVAEHRMAQHRALVEETRSLMAETGELPSMGRISARVGLARSSVYQYFDSIDDLYLAVLNDVLPEWTASVHSRVAAARKPGERAWAYVEANVLMFAGPDHGLALALSKLTPFKGVVPAFREFHAQLQLPLQQALSELGEPEPGVMAGFIDELILHSTHHLGEPNVIAALSGHTHTLKRLHRLLAPYLQLNSYMPDIERHP